MYKNMPKIKRDLIEKRGYFCQSCGISSWREIPLTLEMDHIDGDSSNNREDNLRLLCPNCHSQTKTWKRKKASNLIVTDDQLKKAIESTDNIRQALIYVGLTPKGKNYTRAYSIMSIIKIKPTTDIKNSQFGTTWINKDQINKKVKREIVTEYLNQGWAQGRCWDNLRKVPARERGSYWITNGIDNKNVKTLDQIPAGWRRGRTHLQKIGAGDRT